MSALVLAGGWVHAQTPAARENTGPQIPFGQTYKDFEFPFYQKGQLSYTFYASSATGVTVNRAQASDVKIDIYTDGKVTTNITSPNADIYVADRIMRSKHTVKIERADMEATAQTCDFDLVNRKYLLREKVKVILKNFEIMPSSSNSKATAATPNAALPAPATP